MTCLGEPARKFSLRLPVPVSKLVWPRSREPTPPGGGLGRQTQCLIGLARLAQADTEVVQRAGEVGGVTGGFGGGQLPAQGDGFPVDGQGLAVLTHLAQADAARRSPSGMRERPAGWTEDEHRAFNVHMNEKGIEYYVEKTAEAKAALTALDKYVPEVRERITSSWELREDDEPALRRAIERRGSAALKAERLFRQRRPTA